MYRDFLLASFPGHVGTRLTSCTDQFVLSCIHVRTITAEHSTSIEDVDKFIAALKQKVVRSGPCVVVIEIWSVALPFLMQTSIHPTSLARCLVESTLRGQPNLRCLEFPSFFASGFIQ